MASAAKAALKSDNAVEDLKMRIVSRARARSGGGSSAPTTQLHACTQTHATHTPPCSAFPVRQASLAKRHDELGGARKKAAVQVAEQEEEVAKLEVRILLIRSSASATVRRWRRSYARLYSLLARAGGDRGAA